MSRGLSTQHARLRAPRDARYAIRMLAKSPGFAAVAVCTLAMGIGANTAIFSVANALLLRPLPYPQPDRLVLLSAEKKSSGVRNGPLSFPRFTFINQQSRSFSGVAAFCSEEFNLSGRRDPEQIPSARVSWNFFDILGVAPALGRGFRAEEDQPGGASVVLISSALRARLFGSSASVTGEYLTLDGKDYLIIGVLPADFHFGFFGANVDIVAPRVFDLNIITPQQAAGGSGFLTAVGRLKSGMKITQAHAEMNALSAAYRRENPQAPGRGSWHDGSNRQSARRTGLPRPPGGADPVWSGHTGALDRLRQRGQPSALARAQP